MNLNDLIHIEWLDQIPLKPKLWTYALIKSESCPETYGKFIPKHKRLLLEQLSTGILLLSIRTGRYFVIWTKLKMKVTLYANVRHTHILEKKFTLNIKHVDNFKKIDTFDQFISVWTFHKPNVTEKFIEAVWSFSKSKLIADWNVVDIFMN